MKIHPVLFIAVKFGVPGVALHYAHTQLYGFSLSNTLILWFLVINLWICVWELALYYRFGKLSRDHEARNKIGFYDYSLGPQRLNAIRAKVPWTLMTPTSLGNLCSLEYWANIWLEYGRYDDAYVKNPETFQYNIDVMNGHSTVLPCLLLLTSMFTPVFSPEITGIIGAMSLYQKWYGTLVYLFVFHNCKKGKHLSYAEYIFAVLATNGVWFTVPLLGIYQCAQMVLTQSFAPIQ